MNSKINTLLVVCLMLLSFTGEKKSDTVILINSLGYQPNEVKKATLLTPNSTFEIINAETNTVVYTGNTTGPITQTDVNQTAYLADFTEINQPGSYYLKAADGSTSAKFKIAANAYNEAFYTSMRAMYLWRCGTEVQGTHLGDSFSQKACHLNDGYLDYTEFGAKHKDGTGGWHDAGDYGKYTVNTGITLGVLFMAWDNFNEQLADFQLDLPNTADGYPDFLKELKWETDWLLKMQYPDSSGRVFHKLTRLSFSGFIMPDEDDEKRYFTQWGTSATAHFTGNMAQAARHFKAYDEAYAATCLEAAKKSYAFLKANPEYVRWFQKEFRTGGYQCRDTDARLWAAAEMWETTGEDAYLKDFETMINEKKEKVNLNWDWGNIGNLGVFTYLLSDKPGKNPETENNLKDLLLTTAGSIVASTESDIYGRPFNRYYWGCNGTVARLSVTLYTAYKLTGDKKYKNAAQSIVDHLFGRNYYGRSYVTGLGVNPPLYPHDRRSGADKVEAPWPGYIVGGGHSATDWVDKESSYSHNEIAINWQAALIYALAWELD